MDVPAGVTQEEGHTGFLIHLLSAVHALIFLARRIQPFLSLVDREVEFCVLTILIVLHLLGIFIWEVLNTDVCSMYVCMVITYSIIWINRVRLPILLVVS